MTFFAARPSGVPAAIALLSNVAGRNLRDGVRLRDESGLGALAGARRAEKYQSHGGASSCRSNNG
jgi:hypothetical protein